MSIMPIGHRQRFNNEARIAVIEGVGHCSSAHPPRNIRLESLTLLVPDNRRNKRCAFGNIPDTFGHTTQVDPVAKIRDIRGGKDR